MAKQVYNFNPAIFRAYDIRGIYPDDLYPELAAHIAREFVAFLTRKYNAECNSLKIVVGRDIRHGSLPIAKAFMEEASRFGACVVDIGLVSTDMVYYAVGCLGFDAGVMATASHNPKEYSGLKFVGRGVEGIDGANGVYEIRDRLISGQIFEQPKSKGILALQDLLEDFAKYVVSFVNKDAIKPLTVAIDSGNGSAALTWKAIAKHLPIKTLPLFFELDPNFSGRGPNPGDPSKITALSSLILKEKADIGFAFDGDADRVYAVDETGMFVDGSLLIALMADDLLSSKSNGVILYNVTAGRIIEDTIARYTEAKGIMTPVGHSKIKRMAREHKADFAGEPQSGHYFFKENFYADSAVIFVLKLLEILSKKDVPFSRLVAPYNKYAWSGELNFILQSDDEKGAVIEALKGAYKGKGRMTDIDGIRFDFDDWWFLVRPSNTEPLLRINIEGTSREYMEEKKREVLSVLGLE